MPDIPAASPGQVFISYRRDETAYAAGWLYDRLADRFGADKIFKDIDSIEFGDDFVEVITAAVGSCDVLLALIGNEWVTITGEDGRRRLDDPADFVRVEIEAALARDVRVIPVLVDGASMPHAEALPASLRTLVRRHALALSPSQFDFDTGRLLKVLDRTLAEVQAEVAATASPPPVSTATDEAPSAPAPPEHTGVAPAATVPHEARSSGRRRTPGNRLGRLSGRKRIVAFGAVLVVLLLLIVAAVVSTNDSDGNQDDAEDRQDYVDAMVSSSGEVGLNVNDVECVSESLVDAFGVDALVATGVSPDEIRSSGQTSLLDLGIVFSDEQNREAYERLDQCIDVTALLAAVLLVSNGREAENEAVTCVSQNLPDDLVEQALVPLLTQEEAFLDDLTDPELPEELGNAVNSC